MTTKPWRHTGWARLLQAGAVLLACTQGSGVAAQSAYGCRGLETHAILPAIEGKDGVFFRVLPDLQSHQAMTGQTIAQMGVLSKALAARGTTLVLLPIPSRAQVMAHQLPAQARIAGFDADLAWAVQSDMFTRLEAEGVTIADPREALRRAGRAGAQVFFGTDPRPTTAGSKIIARVVADLLATHPATANLPRAAFSTARVPDDAELPSRMRARLQLACQDPLPPVRTERFVTAGDVASAVSASGIAAVIGTEMTGTQALNFAGFLSEMTGLNAGSYGIEGGGAYAAISSYMTSVDFAKAPPRVLIWETPVWTPFGLQGDQPMQELIAAASGACTTPLLLAPGADPQSRVADLRGLDPNRPLTLALDAQAGGIDRVTFHFKSADGMTRSRSIYRHPDQIMTGRFYMPLSGLLHTGLQSVTITLPQPFGVQPRLSACQQGATP